LTASTASSLIIVGAVKNRLEDGDIVVVFARLLAYWGTMFLLEIF